MTPKYKVGQIGIMIPSPYGYKDNSIDEWFGQPIEIISVDGNIGGGYSVKLIEKSGEIISVHLEENEIQIIKKPSTTDIPWL